MTIGFPDWIAKWYGTSAYNPAGRPQIYHAPADVSVSSDWGHWIAYLFDRYGQGGSGAPNGSMWVEFLEIVNEPNLQMWPQQPSASDTTRIMHCQVGQMMQTAQVIQQSRPGNALLLCGPALSDYVGANGPSFTNVVDFVDALLPYFDSIGFRPTIRFGFSQHNYVDVERGRWSMPASPSDTAASVNRGQLSRQKLIAWAKWTGWSGGSPADPGILLTEGGARLASVQVGNNLTTQSNLLNGALQVLTSGLAVAKGMGMLTNYGLYGTMDSNDAGLRDFYPPGTARPAYGTWKAYPSA